MFARLADVPEKLFAKAETAENKNNLEKREAYLEGAVMIEGFLIDQKLDSAKVMAESFGYQIRG